MNREPIFAALFAKFNSIPGLNTKSRRLRHWSDVGIGEQPALFLAQGNQIAETVTGQPTKWRMFAEVYVYVKTQGNEDPAPVINPLLDAVCAALVPENPMTNTCTLGGLVHYARISGQIETDEGTLGDQAIAIVPIEILVTD